MSKEPFEWTKPAAVIVSICALLASAGSALAAWQSWRTAEAALDVARRNLDESGAVIEVDEIAYLHGDCAEGDEGVVVDLTVRNRGRLPTVVSEVQLGFEIPEWAPYPGVFAGEVDAQVEVAAQQEEVISG